MRSVFDWRSGHKRGTSCALFWSKDYELAVAGAAIGIVCAVIVSHLMATLLYGVKPTDPLSFAGVAALFVGVALLACYLPARRAMKIDPMVALRHE